MPILIFKRLELKIVLETEKIIIARTPIAEDSFRIFNLGNNLRMVSSWFLATLLFWLGSLFLERNCITAPFFQIIYDFCHYFTTKSKFYFLKGRHFELRNNFWIRTTFYYKYTFWHIVNHYFILKDFYLIFCGNLSLLKNSPRG